MSQAAIDLAPGMNAKAFAVRNGLTLVRPMAVGHNTWIMKGPSPQYVAKVVKQLDGAYGVEGVFQDRLIPIKQSSFVPNDPLFPEIEGDWRGQWHLLGENSPYATVRLDLPWAFDYLGAGAKIGIVDGLVDSGHPDLAPNFDLSSSVDLRGEPVGPSHHATAMAGLAAARGGNAIGVTGAAPAAMFGNIALDTGSVAESTLLEAVNHDGGLHAKVYGFNLSAPYMGLEVAGSITSQSFASTGAVAHIFPAGNDRGIEPVAGAHLGDTASHPMLNAPGAIVVAATTSQWQTPYSNYGAAVAVAAPGGESSFGLATTGTSGEVDGGAYTDSFSGTSGAAATVAGVYAVLKSQHPDLTPRLFKHLLALYSDVINESDVSPESDGGWKQNTVGINFNQSYGFGLINASRLSERINDYARVGRTGYVERYSLNDTEITEHSWSEIYFNITGASGRMEELELSTYQLFATDIDGLEIVVTSPSGTESRLKRGIVPPGEGTGINQEVKFTSNAFWGENPQGNWIVRLRFMSDNGYGVIRYPKLTVRTGQPVARALADTFGYDITSTGSFGLPIDLDRTPAAPGTVVQISSSRPDLIYLDGEYEVSGQFDVIPFYVWSTVEVPTPVTITVTSTEGVRTAEFLLSPPGQLSLVYFKPGGTIVGGQSTDFVINLNGAVGVERVVALRSNHPAITVPAQVVIPAGETFARVTLATAGVSSQVEVRVSATLDSRTLSDSVVLTPPVLDGVSISPTQVTGGVSTVGTVTIEGASGPSGLIVNLRSNRDSVSVPPTVTIPAGSSSVTFPVTTSPVTTFTEATIVASHGFRTRFAVLRLVAVAISNHAINPSNVVGGASATGSVTLDSPAPAGGVVITLSSNRPQVVVPASVTIPQGQTTATYTATTTSSGALVQATLYASYQGRTRWTVLNVNPVSVDSLTLSPNSLVGGNSSTGTVTLNGPAPAGGLSIALSSNRAQATLPATVVIPEGATSATFTVNTTVVATQVQATLYASLNGRTRWAVLTIRR